MPRRAGQTFSHNASVMDIVRYNVRMSRYRLQPAPEQESALLRHCSDARYIWNLASSSTPGGVQAGRPRPATWSSPGSSPRPARRTRGSPKGPRPCSSRPCATSTRPCGTSSPGRTAGQPGGRPGSTRDSASLPSRPADVRRLRRHRAEVKVPKVGWVRFRWSRPVPGDVKSYRVTRDRAGRWHVAFARIPHPVPAPGTGEVVGVDRGVKVTAALSTGEMLSCPGLSAREQRRLVRLQRRLAKAGRGSSRRGRSRPRPPG